MAIPRTRVREKVAEPRQATSRAERLEALHKKMAAHEMAGHWEGYGRQEELKPRLWRWPVIMECLQESSELVEIGRADWDDLVREGDRFFSDRRTVKLQSGRTLQMSVQMVKPGERAEGHRHTFNAMRFVVAGNRRAYTTADGEQMVMEPGDLMLQPYWAWHDHTNESDEPVIWLDLHDAKLVHFLADVNLKENWGEGPVQPITRPDGYSRQLYGFVGPRTVNLASRAVAYGYKWADTIAALEAAARGGSDRYGGVLVEYKNPVTGGPTVPTLSCRVQMLRPLEETRAHRHMGLTVYHVVQGRGITSVGQRDERAFRGGPAGMKVEAVTEELRWEKRDCFSIPSWRWHSHKNSSMNEPAILFSMTDAPVLQALGLYQEEGS